MQDIAASPSSFAEGIPIDFAVMDEPPPSTWVYGDATTRVTDEFNRGVFLSDTTTLLDRLTLQGSVRYDQYRRSQRNLASGNSSSVSDSAISPSAGAVIHVVGGPRDPLGINVYGSWGRGFSPVFRAVSNTEIVEVDPERSQSFEAGAKVQGWRSKLATNIAAFQLDRNDVVGWNPDTQNQENVGDWRIRGVEFSVRGRPVESLIVYAGATVRKATIERDDANRTLEGNRVPFVADTMGTAGVEYAPDAGLGGGAVVRAMTESYADDANEITLPGAWLLDASVSYRWREMTVAGFVRNALDADYYSAVFQGVRYGSAFAGTPRTYGVSAAIEY